MTVHKKLDHPFYSSSPTMGPSKRILCVGLCNLDIIQVCDAFPEEDSDQRSLQSRWQRGGNASNNCTVLALLGADAELLATFADSDHFRFAAERDLERRGIAIENCVRHEGCEIPLSTVWLSAATGSRTIVHSNPNLPELTVEDFRGCDLSLYSWVHFEVCRMNFLVGGEFEFFSYRADELRRKFPK